MRSDDRTGIEEISETTAVIAAEQACVFEIDLAKTYVVILTLPAETPPALENETCAHLTQILADWAEDDYPNKFLVIGLRKGASITFQQAAAKALDEEGLRFYDKPIAEIGEDGHLRLADIDEMAKDVIRSG